MLRFDKTTLVLPLCMSILLIRLSNNLCEREVLLFSEFINIVLFLQDIIYKTITVLI